MPGGSCPVPDLMQSFQTAATRALRDLLAGQPTTAAKVRFAWRMAAGAALARSGELHWSDSGVLRVNAREDAWRRELRHASPILIERMNHLLGAGVVKRIVITGPAEAGHHTHDVDSGFSRTK